MKQKQWIVLGVLFLITWLFIYWQAGKTSKIGYVDLKQVFNEFTYTKELKKDLLSVQGARQKLLDSMEFELKMLSKEIETNKSPEAKRKFDVKLESLMKFRKSAEEDNLAFTEQLDNKILSQMNQYIKDFGKENGYDIIVGSQGDGTIMYASDILNLTKESIVYINNKYKGGK